MRKQQQWLELLIKECVRQMNLTRIRDETPYQKDFYAHYHLAGKGVHWIMLVTCFVRCQKKVLQI